MPKKFDINIARVYDFPLADGTYRILVDRLWPRGIKKSNLQFDEWNKEIAPSTELRKWFDHKSERFDEFAELYEEELKQEKEELNRIKSIAKNESITLLYGAKDPTINHAIVLKNILMKKS